jgi:hypothetical protein
MTNTRCRAVGVNRISMGLYEVRAELTERTKGWNLDEPARAELEKAVFRVVVNSV